MNTRLVYLKVPDSFKNQYDKSKESFYIDPVIPIPIEVTQDSEENQVPANLSMEMIIRGMLRAIEEKQVEKKWIDYYSAFVLYLRPDILEIVQEEMDHRITRIDTNEE